MSSIGGGWDPRSQAFLRPRERRETRIDNIKMLYEDSDFAEWKIILRQALRPLQLQDLIRTDLPRPTRYDRDYKAWLYYSTIVGGWLYMQCSPGFRRLLDYTLPATNEDDFADEIMDRIEKVFVRNNTYGGVTFKMHTFAHMKRAQYETIGDFIADFQSQVRNLHNLKVSIPLPYALMILFEQLENELPVVVYRREELRDVAPEDITRKMFNEICGSLRMAARMKESTRDRRHLQKASEEQV